MRCLLALGLGLGLVLSGLVVASDYSDFEGTLRLLLAKSDVVAVGKFTTEPVGKKGNDELRSYQADFQITQAIKWDAPGEIRAGATIKVWVLIDGEERPPELKKGGKCLLFLECYELKPTPSYITADLWFGHQRPRRGLTKTLAQIVAWQKKTPLRVPAEKDIVKFYPDPIRRNTHFKDFKVDKADLVKILRDYHVIPKQDWKHNYCHVGGEDRTGTIVVQNKTNVLFPDLIKIQYLVRPGGLASLTFPDGRKLFLAREKLP